MAIICPDDCKVDLLPVPDGDGKDVRREFPMAHHIWCNYFFRPEEGCKMCESLREKYPEDCSPDELIEKHFPDVVVRTKQRAEPSLITKELHT